MFSNITLATAITLIIVAAAAAAAIVFLVKNKNRGCCGDCSKCAMRGDECGASPSYNRNAPACCAEKNLDILNGAGEKTDFGMKQDGVNPAATGGDKRERSGTGASGENAGSECCRAKQGVNTIAQNGFEKNMSRRQGGGAKPDGDQTGEVK